MPPRSVVTIVKASGERAPFDPRKIAATCRRAGASARLAKRTAAFVASRVREGMATQDILALAHRCLVREDPRVAIRYTLKDAMRRLGPAGYDFEVFVAEILRAYGATATLPDLIPGMCVAHEVDVVTEQRGSTAMVECKYRNEPGIHVRLKDIMATWARYEDLREAHRAGKHPYAFTRASVICNTKITSDGLAFGRCKGMELIGWRYPATGGLERMIEERHLYPITVLRSVDRSTQAVLAQVGIMLCHDLTAREVDALVRETGLPRPRLARIRSEITEVLRC